MTTVKSDIEEFNRYVKLNYQGLQARGERCDDIMIHLSKVYLVALDREFVTCIELKKMEHEEGRNRLLPEELMILAFNKISILHKQNMWNIKSPEEEKVIALIGKVQKLTDANLKLSKYLEDKKSPRIRRSSPIGTINGLGRRRDPNPKNHGPRSTTKQHIIGVSGTNLG